MVTTCYKICYLAKYPDGSLLDKDKPFYDAYVEAESKEQAISKLKQELPGLTLLTHGDPQPIAL